MAVIVAKSLVILVALTISPSVVVVQALFHGSSSSRANKTMLAIGDSLCTGQLPIPPNAIPFSDKGYNDVLFDYLESSHGFTSLLKVCCPGDSSVEFLDGSANLPLDDGSLCYGQSADALSSQMDAALQAMASGEVELISISLGANDLLPCVVGAAGPVACALARIDALVSNLKVILDTLLASASSFSDDDLPFIFAMTPYNALLALSLSNEEFEKSLADLSQLGTISLHAIVTSQVYEPYGVAVVDGIDVYDGLNTTNVNGIPQNVKTVCEYTGMCSLNDQSGVYELAPPQDRDIHPTEDGYAKLGEAHIALIEELVEQEPSSSSRKSSSNTKSTRKTTQQRMSNNDSKLRRSMMSRIRK